MLAVARRQILLPPNIANPRAPVIIAQSAVAVSGAADTNENTLATITVPGGAMGPNGVLRFYTLWSFTNSANTKTGRARLGGIGGTAFMSWAQTAFVSANFFMGGIFNRGAANQQIGQPLSGSSFTIAFGGACVTGAVDTNQDQTLVITGQKALAGETFTLEAYLAELLYGA
jgi:hypothetical protein